MLTGLIVLILAGILVVIAGDAAGLAARGPGSSWTPLESPSALFSWPFDPSLLWFRLADTVPAVAGLALITVISHAAGAVAVFVVAGLLGRADTAAAAARTPRRYGRFIAAVWAVAIPGSLVAVNLVPVGDAAGSSCSVSGGSVQPAPGTIIGGDRGAIPYAFRHGGTFTACAMTQNRAWFTDATVEGVDAGRLPAAPWRVTLVRDAAPGFRPISPVRLTPRSTRMMFVLVRFTSCRPGMSGRAFTLANLPLRVRAYGRTQTDPVPLSQPVRTSCP
jgi:hypothetical protein